MHVWTQLLGVSDSDLEVLESAVWTTSAGQLNPVEQLWLSKLRPLKAPALATDRRRLLSF